MAGGGSALAIASLILAAVFGTTGTTTTALEWIDNIFWFGLAALPVSMGVAILRYRLYEIDRIMSRTLAYTIVTGLLIGVYAGLVLLATRVLSVNSPVAVAGPRWPPRPCSPRCGAGCKRRWTGGSTGPGTTPKPPWPRSLPA